MPAFASQRPDSRSLAADLERRRLEQRAARMRAVVRELRAMDRRIGELSDRPPPRRRETRGPLNP